MRHDLENATQTIKTCRLEQLWKFVNYFLAFGSFASIMVVSTIPCNMGKLGPACVTILETPRRQEKLAEYAKCGISVY